MTRKRIDVREITICSLLIALAFVLSYIENLIPISLGIPGAKLGLANLATLTALYTVGTGRAAFVCLVRIVLAGFTFGSLSMMIYSLAGGGLSLAVMVLLKRAKASMVSVSVLGGVAHNIGQLAVAALVTQTAGVFTYLPFLLGAGTVAGAFVGLLGGMVTERLKRAVR